MNKKIIAIGGLLTMAFVFTGCRGNGVVKAQTMPKLTQEATQTPQASETQIEAPIEIDTQVPLEKGARIAVVAKCTDSGYWKAMKKNMQEAVDYLNQAYAYTGEDEITMTFEGPKEEEDVTSQINIIDAVLAENPTVVCLAATDVNSCQAQLETAQENGIPVIMYDSGVTSDLETAFCGTDNRKAGEDAADHLSEAIGESGKVIVLAHENYTQTSKDRVKGFKQQLKKQHPNVTVAAVTYENEEESLEEAVRRLLEEDPAVKGIFCTNDLMSKEALEILKDYEERDIQVVGFDSGSVQQEAIEEGREYGTIVQNVYEIAYKTIWSAVRAAAGEKVEEELLVSHIWIDQSNLYSEENMEHLYH